MIKATFSGRKLDSVFSRIPRSFPTSPARPFILPNIFFTECRSASRNKGHAMALYVRTEELLTVTISEAGQCGINGTQNRGYFHAPGKLHEESGCFKSLLTGVTSGKGVPRQKWV
jgi:hypothetical protein